MTKTWTITHGLDPEWSLVLIEQPWWVSPYSTALGFLQRITFHKFCCRMPEWTYRIPIGKKDLDPEPMEDGRYHNFNSLGSRMWGWSTSVEVYPYNKEKRLLTLPIDREQAFALSPDWVQEIEDIFSDVDEDA